MGQVDLAGGLAKRSVEKEPDFVRGWLLTARLELDRGDVLGARAAHSRALEAIEEGTGRARTGYQASLVEYEQDQLRILAMELR
jgi:hypothetical protein